MSTLLQRNLPDLNLETALPFIEHVIEEEYEAFPNVAEKLFNVGSMKNGIVQHSQISSLGPAAEVGEAEEIPQDRVVQGYSTTYLAKKYGLLLATSQEAIDHERFDSIKKNPAKMGRAVASTREITAAAHFNNGFSATGSDGKALFATDHPLLSPGAGVSSNTLGTPADLDATSLKDLITLMRKTLDTSGNKIMVKPKFLVVPSALEFKAYELVKSIYAPDSSYNNLSGIGPQGLYNLEVVVWDYLTDEDSFFLVADKMDHELHWFWDKQPEIKTQLEFKSDVALTRILTRFVSGYSDWRGVAGSPGTG
jgi:hypothetical protein